MKDSRTERQMLSAAKWRKSAQYGAIKNGSGILHIVGGFGKTYLTVNFIIKPMLANNPATTITIMVARKELVNQWKKELDNNLPMLHINRVRVVTIHSLLHNDNIINTTLLVADEIHKMYGEQLIQFINGNKIKFKYNLGLTATPYDKENNYMAIEYMWPIIDKISIQEATKNKWISEFTEYNLPIQLDNNDANTYMSITNTIDDISAKFGGFDVIKNINNGQKDMFGHYIHPDIFAINLAKEQGWGPTCEPKINREWNPSVLRNEARLYFMKLIERKSFLNNHIDKITAVIEIVKTFDNMRIISFSESTIFADIVAAKLNEIGFSAVAYHSNIQSRTMLDNNGQIITYKSGKRKGQPKIFGKTVLKRLAVSKISSGEAKIISTASALDEGFNVEAMRIGIITSRTTNSSRQMQRGFRVIRVDPYDKSAHCIIVNIYFANTQDEKWIKEAQKDTKNKIVYISSIDEIKLDDSKGVEL